MRLSSPRVSGYFCLFALYILGNLVRSAPTLEQLQTLPGVGPAIAKSIVEYRTKVGKFSKIEDILNVKGIGEKKFQRMKDRLTI